MQPLLTFAWVCDEGSNLKPRLKLPPLRCLLMSACGVGPLALSDPLATWRSSAVGVVYLVSQESSVRADSRWICRTLAESTLNGPLLTEHCRTRALSKE
jgi:hypothetical protein